MKTKIYLLLLFLLTINGFSQETKMSIKEYINFSDLPLKNSKTPNWANQFYENPDQININKLTIDIDNWVKSEKNERKEKVKKENESEQDNELNENISENPIVRFASLFINRIPINWINEAGFIEMPTKNAFIKNAENLEKEKINKKRNVLANNWSLIGSKEVVENGQQIVSCSNIYHLSVAPTSTNIRLASSETGVLYKTTDSGENWSTIAEYPGPSAFHPTDVNKIILGSNPFRRSSDGGATWTIIPVVAECNKIIWSDNGNTILAATNMGVFVSSDGGLSFSQKLPDTFFDVEFKPGSSTIAYAVNYQGVFYKSTDAGLTWAIKQTSYSLTTPKYGFLLAVTPANPDLVSIAFTTVDASYDGTIELLKSTNSGDSFASLSTFPVGFSSGFYAFVFGISPVNENTYFVSSNTLFKSTNGGTSFSPVGGYAGPFKVHADIQDIVLFGNTVVLSTDGGVSESTDSFTSLSNWKSTSKGLDARYYEAFDVGFNTDQMGGGTMHNGYAIYNPEWNNGKSIYISDGEEAHGKAIFSRPNSMYFPGTGKNFKQVDVTYNPNFSVTYPFSLDNTLYNNGFRNSDTTSNTQDSNIIYAATGNDIVVSYDNGITKQVLKSFDSTVWDIKTTRKDAKVLYALTYKNGIWKTIDGGAIWTPCNKIVNGVDLTILGIYCYIDVSQTNANEIWLLFRNLDSVAKICKSIDGGQSWISLNSPILNGFAGLQIVHQYGSNGGVYIMGSQNDQSKCYYKNDTMPDWIDYSSGIMMRTSITNNVFLKATYYKEKLRVAGQMGVQEIAFYEKSSPVAQPTTNIKNVCVNQEIKFCDYSILDYTGATWLWSFSKTPIYLNGTNAGSRDPIVKFLSPGVVNVTLKVTNSSGQFNSKTITNFVTVNYDAASCLLLNSDNDFAVNCINNLPNPPAVNTAQEGIITNFNGATTGKFLVKMNLYTNCAGGRTATFSALVNLDTNQISTIRYSHFEDGVLPISVTGDNTNIVTSFSNRYAQVSFRLINKILYLNHVSNYCTTAGQGIKTVNISELCWQPFTASGITSGDFAELQKCNNQIPQSAAVSDATGILVTDFANATSGLFYVNVNGFTSCNNVTNNLKAIINLDSDVINVLQYKHYDGSFTSGVSGNETATVSSNSTANAPITYYLSNNKLYAKRPSDPCGGTNFRLNASCWSAMDDDNNGIDNALQPSNCTNSLSTNLITNADPNFVKDFSSFAPTQPGVFVTLNINTSCNNTNATAYLNVDLDNNLIHVINYKHFGSTTFSTVLNNDSPNVYSESAANGKLKFSLINDKLYIQRVSTPCSGSNYQVTNSCYSLGSDQILAINNFISNSVATLVAYPNPTTNSFTINTKNEGSDYSLSIFNIDGKFITSKFEKTSDNLLQVNMEQYAQGLYFVILFNKVENKYNYLKIIKK